MGGKSNKGCHSDGHLELPRHNSAKGLDCFHNVGEGPTDPNDRCTTPQKGFRSLGCGAA